LQVERRPPWLWLLAALGLAAGLLLVLLPLFLRRAAPRWDALDFYLPNFVYLADSLREGRFPLWDPYTNCGEPFFADPQKMVLGPVALLLARLWPDPYTGFLLLWLCHWWWAGAGMLWLCREEGTGLAAGLLAAAGYAACGFFVSNAEHLPYLVVGAWLPWLVGLADTAVARRSLPRALLAASALSACALGGGYPMLVAAAGLAVALWLFLRHLAFAPEGAGPLRLRIAWCLGTLAGMAALLAIAWAPVLHAFLTEGAAVGSRLSAVTADESLRGAPVGLRTLPTLFFPSAAGALLLLGFDLGADLSMTSRTPPAIGTPGSPGSSPCSSSPRWARRAACGWS
jgi:hypothetical protein